MLERKGTNLQVRRPECSLSLTPNGSLCDLGKNPFIAMDPIVFINKMTELKSIALIFLDSVLISRLSRLLLTAEHEVYRWKFKLYGLF